MYCHGQYCSAYNHIPAGEKCPILYTKYGLQETLFESKEIQ